MLDSTPRADGFRMPGEFEKHANCWMLWPERPDVWRQSAKPAQKAFATIAHAIKKFEPVTIGVSKNRLPTVGTEERAGLRIVIIDHNDDAWMRDCGPTFVTNAAGEVRGIDWQFNAWGGLNGGCYYPWDQDAQVAQKLLAMLDIPRYPAPLILEGGAFHVDGEGSLITTEECLLNPNRNPQLSKSEIENYLREYLGVEQIIWLGQGVYNDETDGHVDNLCCFIRPGVVALSWTDDLHDPQYEISRAALKRLQAARDARGRRLEIHKLHQPGPLYRTAEEAATLTRNPQTLSRAVGERLAASYVNFYLANGAVIMPIFNDPHDEAAVRTLEQLYPEREVVPLYSREVLLGGGNIHCITQQQPQGI